MVALAAFAPAPALSQSLQCAPRAQVLDMLAKQEQTRRALGQAGVAMMELFAEDDSQHWTLTVTFRDGRTCLLARGIGYEARDEVFPKPGTAS
ncbi:MAG: hypothetical protein EA339_07055 [Rhodobacteraceae bacterium]|nr:MAG: hypothetical protein EA339_07055 [Paracoccaceae bacterium]